MSFYSLSPAIRTRQIIADVAAAVTLVIAVVIALTVSAAIRAFASFGITLENAGAGIGTGASETAEQLGGIPLVGGGVRAPLDAIANAGDTVAQAGRDQQAFVDAVATGTGWALVLVPLVFIALLWLPSRLRFARRSSQLRAALAGGMSASTLAMRALGAASIPQLTAIHPDPGAALAQGDRTVERRLAELELRRLGIAPDALL